MNQGHKKNLVNFSASTFQCVPAKCNIGLAVASRHNNQIVPVWCRSRHSLNNAHLHYLFLTYSSNMLEMWGFCNSLPNQTLAMSLRPSQGNHCFLTLLADSCMGRLPAELLLHTLLSLRAITKRETNLLVFNCGRVCRYVSVDKHHTRLQSPCLSLYSDLLYFPTTLFHWSRARHLKVGASFSTVSCKCHGSDVTWFEDLRRLMCVLMSYFCCSLSG